MAGSEKRIWMTLRLLSQANEEIAARGGVPGDVAESEAWIRGHLRRCPPEFAYEDWSDYQPAIRKIYLIGTEGEGER
jgi:hypothetical protein